MHLTRSINCTLIDTCTTSHFITEEFSRKLWFRGQECSIPIGVLNGCTTLSKNIVTNNSIMNYRLQSICNVFTRPICLTMPSLNQSDDRCKISIQRLCKKLNRNFIKRHALGRPNDSARIDDIITTLLQAPNWFD